MDPATGAIGRLLPKLEDLLKNMGEEVASLRERLALIQSVLRDVDGMPMDQVNAPMKRWSREARDLSFDIEHVVDKFRARQLRARQLRANDATAGDTNKGIISKISYKMSIDKASRRFATEFRGLSDKLTELIKEQGKCADELRDRDDTDVGEPEPSVRRAGSLAGLHSRVEKLASILTDDGGTSSRQLKVASILGMPGAGKTTLANQVYKRLVPRFECSAWVTVSTMPDVKNVLRNMLSQITPQGDANFGLANIQETIDEIRKALKDKRYFILFDDICDNKAWEIIKYALVDVSNLSAVLMTSRKVSVARYACGIIYRLKSLSDISSEKLLTRRFISGSGDNCPPELANTPSRVIAKNRGKAPEGVDTVVGTSTGVHVPPRVGRTRGPYTLLQGPSVSTLPRHLKPCLMYLSMFQKGQEISTDRLVWGWIAEGFIPGDVEMTLREQGESYLSDLISRGFLVAIKIDAGGKARSCRLPDDEVHRSITSLSAEENSVTIVDGQQVTPLPTSVRRLSIQGNNPLSPQVPLSRVRSLVVSGDANTFHQETGGINLFPSLTEFEHLSVLDLGGCASLKNDHLKSIDSMLLLKYLVLGGDCITDIPRKIGSLVFLQTLDLRATRVKELPESIAWARKLECLLVNRHTKIPDVVGKMKSLQVLGDINISRGKLLDELGNLPALRVLRIVIWSWDGTYDKELFRYLGSLSSQKIQSLSIFICCSLDFLEKLDAEPTPNQHLQEFEIRHSTFVHLPKWISSLTKLSSLSIEVHKLSQPIIEMLGELDTLRSLFLTSKFAPEGNFRNGFKNLTSFRFVSSALGMIFVLGGMLNLERLHLSFQASLTKDLSQDFDFGLENLSSLKHIHVEIICFNASSGLVQDIKKAITRAIQRNRSGGAELVIDEVRTEDMEKNEDGKETQGCSPVEYFDLIKKFSSDQRQVIEEVGFGYLLKMKAVIIRHELCKRLAEAYDVQSEAFNIRGSMLQISIDDVGLLMGIPSEGKEIVEVPKMKNLVLLSSYKYKNGTISLDTLHDYLSNSKDNDENFIRRVLLYTIGMLLCPTAQRTVSTDYLNLLENVEQIKTVNWASLTLHHLKDSLKKYKTGKASIEGNLVLLQLWYWEKMYISKPE
uniref:Uncharacterized protein n=1 Tax=Avena sativa TaxID=4498 RepID=A0ACD5Z3U2_AVESA